MNDVEQECAYCYPLSFLRGTWGRSFFDMFKHLSSTTYFPFVAINCGMSMKQIGTRMKTGTSANCMYESLTTFQIF
jgi:hypothetical protein